MTNLIVVPQQNQWSRLKALVLDSVSSPITKRVYNLGPDEFFAWYAQKPRPGFTKATVAAWRVQLQARGLGAVSINVRITAARKLAVEAADNGLLPPELANVCRRQATFGTLMSEVNTTLARPIRMSVTRNPIKVSARELRMPQPSADFRKVACYTNGASPSYLCHRNAVHTVRTCERAVD
jgi:hypothetical protein